MPVTAIHFLNLLCMSENMRCSKQNSQSWSKTLLVKSTRFYSAILSRVILFQAGGSQVVLECYNSAWNGTDGISVGCFKQSSEHSLHLCVRQENEGQLYLFSLRWQSVFELQQLQRKRKVKQRFCFVHTKTKLTGRAKEMQIQNTGSNNKCSFFLYTCL